MPDLLLELFSEEIPARMQRRAADDLRKMLTNALVDAGLTYEGAAAYWTPRRLSLDVRGLTARSPEQREERKGPRVDAPEKAIEGFVRNAGLSSVDEAERRSDPKKGDHYVAVVVRPGRDASDIVAAAVPDIVRNFPWPKSMRWGAASREPGSLRWVRPLQAVLCVLGPETEETEIVPFEIEGIASGRTTYGHRFMAPEPIEVRRFDDYVEHLRGAKVIVDGERRKDAIRSDAQNLCFARGLELVEDEGLLEEVANLVEWPVVLASEFPAEFLEIPDEVIRLTIRTNQKCFVTRRDGALSNTFVLVSNIEASDGGEEIAKGNAKVVQARLSDAFYFWQTDQAQLPDAHSFSDAYAKFGLDPRKPLDQRMAKLEALGVTFHREIGTQGDRVARIRKLVRDLAPIVEADAIASRRAAALAKADLTTEAVGEFPELQGFMGRRYAALQGEPNEVAVAIEEHYRPQGPNDPVPSNAVGVAVALADKLDTLVQFWRINEKPTGSKDPYALRRAALGVIRILREKEIKLPLRTAFALAGATDNVASDLLSFFHDRLKVYLRDLGARYDLIDAVIGDGADDVNDIAERVEALSSFLSSNDGADLIAGYRRAANILNAERKKGWEGDRTVYAKLFKQEEELSLAKALNEAEASSVEALEQGEFERAMTALAGMREPLDAFFEAVLVNAEHVATRANRLALLGQVRDAIERVADLSKVEG